MVKYKVNGSDDWKKCVVLGRGGKATGPYRYNLNIKNLDDDTEMCIDWKKEVQEWQKTEVENVLTVSSNDPNYDEAKEKELQNWKNLEVYEEVEDVGQDRVSVKWVLNEKEVDNVKIKKARLVARGFQEENDDLPTDSPTCNNESKRAAYAVIASKKWDVNSLDVKAAFLQGKDLDRKIYLKPPKEAKCPGKLWSLKKCVYGLDDASRFWYFRVKEELNKLGCKKSKYDSSLFICYKEELEGLLIVHVDDFLWAGSDKFKQSVIMKLKESFKISKESSTNFKYLGIEVEKGKNGLYVSQNKYMEEKLKRN